MDFNINCYKKFESVAKQRFQIFYSSWFDRQSAVRVLQFTALCTYLKPSDILMGRGSAATHQNIAGL
ncbi:MAG: hypothetical protein AUK48_05595 [Oscillatoriales cyanobacterium CG2_30_44_21]|nr:MAG: hypothetical protein AUK48_05595 [Oscillatoriales cyanobacterium CG2_30_44_21]